MTAQRLYGILQFIEFLDQELSIQTTLEGIKSALTNLANAPAQPNWQNNLATGLATLSSAVTKMAEEISPSDAALIREIGGADYFDPALAANIKESVATNAMTPAVARDFVNDFTSRRSSFLNTVGQASESLKTLGIEESDLKPGTADVAFLIPRNIFSNELGAFAKELKFISRLVQDLTEAQTGSAEPVLLEQLSSSIPTVALTANLVALGVLAAVINRFLDAWLKIERIRKSRAELEEIGIRGEALKELDQRITTTVKEVIEESTVLALKNYPAQDNGRKRELENSIRLHVNELFGQIEKGLTVEFRAKPQDGDGDGQNSVKQIAGIAKSLKFPPPTSKPLLLGKGKLDEVEDVVVVHTKKTRKTTTTTTTTAKEPKKDGKE